MKTGRPFIKILLATLAMSVGGGLAAAENPVSNVSLNVALKDAGDLVSGRPDFKVLRVEGGSMLPYFGSGAVLVVKQIPAGKLRAGMVVVYTNRFNETVAHRLVGESPAAGWIARGYNNRASDSTTVNGDNLVGVVYATFHTNAMPADSALLAANTAVPVALAAPAR